MTDPNGVPWTVDVHWTDVRFGRHVTGRAAERRARRVQPAREIEHAVDDGLESPRSNRWSWLDVFDPFAGIDDLPGLAAVLVVVAMVVLAFVGLPWVPVVVLDVIEVVSFPVVAFVVIAWRVARHRPFTITAERHGASVARWRVAGLREARRHEQRIADAIVAGGDAVTLFPDLAAT